MAQSFAGGFSGCLWRVGNIGSLKPKMEPQRFVAKMFNGILLVSKMLASSRRYIACWFCQDFSLKRL